MADTEEKKRPEYKHNKGKCGTALCEYYVSGYCKVTGACMDLLTLSNPMMMGKKKGEADCEPFLIDLRQDAEKNWPEYQIEPEPVIDESVGKQILKELRKLNKRLDSVAKSAKKFQEDMYFKGSG